MKDQQALQDGDERQRQIDHARTLSRPKVPTAINKPKPNQQGNTKRQAGQKAPANVGGHEAFLKNIEASENRLRITVASSGEVVDGFIKATDKYTVSLKVNMNKPEDPNAYIVRVFFKHDISEFSPIIAALHKKV